MIKESEMKLATPIINQANGQKVKNKKMSSSPFPMFLALVRNLEEYFNISVYSSSSKKPTPLNVSSLWGNNNVHCKVP